MPNDSENKELNSINSGNNQEIKRDSRYIATKKLIKGSFIITAAPAIILIAFAINGHIEVYHAVFLFVSIFLLSLLFVHPYLADLQELTNYVKKLARNEESEQPQLSFLNNVEELSQAISDLNKSWQIKNKDLQSLIEEDRILINSLPSIIIMLNEKLEIVQYNETAAKNVFSRLHQKHINSIVKDHEIIVYVKEVIRSGKSESMIYEINEPEWRVFNVKFKKFPAMSPSKISLLIVLQDITAEKKNQAMLSDFVANASHELKTPLASISGFVETLSEVDNDPEAQKQFLGIMKEQAERMQKLINDLLTLSVVESGAGKANFEKLDVKQLSDEAVKGLENFAADKNSEIKEDVKSGLPKIFGNKDEILRVFDNLISNAIKYSPQESKIKIYAGTISNEELKSEYFAEDQMLLFYSVEDNGEGIAEEDIPRITERFYRVNKVRKGKTPGSGIGLSIVKHIIHNHEADLDIKSKLGEGSKFTVYFPVS